MSLSMEYETHIMSVGRYNFKQLEKCVGADKSLCCLRKMVKLAFSNSHPLKIT